MVTPAIPGGYTIPSEFEATLTWANGIKQITKTTVDDSPGGSVINEKGQRNGVKFEGADGWIFVNRSDLTASDDAIISTPLPETALHLEKSGDHMGNFFDCVRSRKDPVCPVEVGHRSATIGHLIVIAMRLGLKLQWDPYKQFFVGSHAKEANQHVTRIMRQPHDYTFIG